MSTKLNSEEHEKFLEFCNKKGLTTSGFVKRCILTTMESEAEEAASEWDWDKLKEELGLKK